jgi:adenosylmethionine-8-amino-7-oxononanoate aminotransferase
MEAALKLAYQYHAYEKPSPQPQRTKFIARDHSYHGATLGALNMSGHEGRKTPYHPILSQNVHFIPSCNPYRNRLDDETNEQYVEKRSRQRWPKVMTLRSMCGPSGAGPESHM